MTRDSLISVAIAACTLLCGLLVVAGVGGWPRAVLVVSFLLVGPGLAFVRLFRVTDPATVVALAVVASLAFEVVIATALLAAELWSSGTALAIVVILTLGTVVLKEAS